MKKVFFNLAITFIFSIGAMNAGKAQCTNPAYQDLTKKQNLNVDFTLINAGLQNGSHTFTAWGDGHLTPSANGGCIYVSDTVYIFYSDRLITTTAGAQPFSIKQLDKSTFTFDFNANTITQTSLTWNFSSVYGNCIRQGHLIYGFSGANMIVLNIR